MFGFTYHFHCYFYSGIGIDLDHLLSIFQPFSNADQSLTRKYGGIGLGLRMGDDCVIVMIQDNKRVLYKCGQNSIKHNL